MWFHALCVLALSACVSASVVISNDIDAEINTLFKANSYKYKEAADGCLALDASLVCDEDPDDQNLLPSGTLCFYVDETFNTKLGSEIICDQQEWKPSFNSDVKVSRKLLTHETCTRSRRRRLFRRSRRSRCTKINHSPSFKSCPSVTKTTPSKATSMSVTWNTPTAEDEEDDTLSVIHTDGEHSGDILAGSASGISYTASYKVTDSANAFATCRVKINVKVIVCPVPTNPDNGFVSCPNGRNYGWQCTFSCNAGYSPTIPTSTCLSDGQWSDQGVSECRGIVCPQQLPIIDHGHYVCDTYTYGSTCKPVCESAYNESTNYPIACTKNGQWTEPPSKVCKDTNPPTLLGCPTDITVRADVGMTSAIVTWAIPTATDMEDGTATVKQTIGSISPDQRVEGDDQHMIAYRAFDSSDNPSSECSFTVQVEVIRCPAISALTNGVYSCTESNLYGSQCSFTCHKGYQLQGTNLMKCKQTGLWDMSMPTCSEIVCYAPDQYGYTIENGYYDECPSTITYQSSCKPKCNDGFKLEQAVTAVCVVNSDNNPDYSIPQTPECRDKEPPTFPTCGENGVVLTFDAIKGTRRATIDYTQPLATDNIDLSPVVTKLHGPEVGDTIYADTIETVEFQAKDNAGNPSPMCVYRLQVQVIECPVYVPTTAYGEMMCTADSIYGSKCTLKCDEGYQANGLDETECLQDGSWSVSSLECIEKLCPAGPSAPLNGYYDCLGLTTFPFNSFCFPVCDEGFTLQQKSSYARCKADQTWAVFNSPECRDTTPPSFTNCVNTLTVTADKQHSSAVVTWSEPVATDNVDEEPTVTQTSGPSSGSSIEGTVIVKYEAKDVAGNPNICEMEIEVQVIQCPSHVWTPDVATIVCGHGTLYGSICRYTCEDGFEVSEPSDVECLDDSTWSYGFQPPTCSRITCNAPDAAANGIYYCPDTSYEYESICYLHCNDGYSVKKPVSVECDKDGQWILKSTEQCQDTVPPTLYSCQQNQLLLLERGKDTTVANWILPKATDNVDSEEEITIELVSVTEGAESGSELSVGTYIAEYRARDTNGNPSVVTCSITLTVEEVTCSEPKYSFVDDNLMYNCSSYRWGDNCTLSCTTASSYTFQGPDTITCEKTYWSYEGSSQPSCEEAACQEDLNVPINGAVTYSGGMPPLAQMTCTSTHDLPLDLPYQFSGYSFCKTNTNGSSWSINPLPDCTRSFRPGLNVLPLTLYYEGDCNDPDVQTEMKEQLEQTLLNPDLFLGTDFDCISDNTCGLDDFIVDCGNERKKRDSEDHNIVKKQTDSTVGVQFNLFLEGAIENFNDVLRYEEQLILMYDHLSEKCENNECDIQGYPFVPGSMTRADYSTIECTDPGHVMEGLSCKSCAMGYFMQNIDGSKKCVKCPIGTYTDEDSASNCTSCPPGKSTLNIGSKSLDMCIDLCPAGSQSSSGLKPCTPCREGYYKDIIGQGSCLPCIPGQTSFAPGQTSCSSYDVTLSGDQIVEIHQTAIPIDEITTLFWILKDCASQIVTEFATSVLTIEISDYILINGNSVMDYSPYCNMWTNVAVSVHNSGYSLFINGDLIESDTEPSMIQLPDNSDILLGFTTVPSRADTSILVSSYAIIPRQLTAEEINNYQTSCYNEFDGAILTSDDLIHRYEGIEANAPTCMAINHCGDSPCGSRHLCTPTIDGYVCICSDGYTGSTCDIPPDFCEQNDCTNGATCVSLETSYTCTCPLGYKGKFCKTPPVIGGWGDWSKWGTCSKSCDVGVRERTRVCDNPAPTDHGIPCSGEIQEEEDCNVVSCQIAFPCSANPCGDHTCRETSTGFVCECNPGYTGSLCLDVIDNCDPNPCYNAGTCINEVAGFQCECPARFSGDVCEEESRSRWYWSLWSTCSATCGGGTSTRHIICAPGVSYCPDTEESKVCNEQSCPVDNCVPLACNNHGVCVSSTDDYSCICDTGYTGKSCEPVDFCVTNPCVHGQCSNSGTSYSCSCQHGFIGMLCETDAENGNWGEWNDWGSCDVTCGAGVRQRSRSCDNPSPGPGGLDCDGIATETGQCKVECHDSCSSNPCGSDHNCVEENDSYTCHCKHGYTGRNCLTPPDVCDPNPCDNGGVCRNNENTPECHCINGYSGLTCTVHPDVSAWYPWSDWTDCSATCGGGSRSRTRQCKHGSQGDSCDGRDTDIDKCGQNVCPSCPDLPKFYKMNKLCTRNETEETVECTLSCKPGYFPSQPTVTHEEWSIKFTCGPFTSFKWDTTARTIACAAGKAPTLLKLPVGMPFKESNIPCNKADSVKAQLLSKITDVACQVGPPCVISVSLPKCTAGSNRKKREILVATEIEMEFTLDLSNYTGENSAVDFWQVANDSLSPLITTAGTWLTVEVDGTTYVVDTTNYTDDAVIECEEGFFLQEGYAVCAGCVPGSWFDSSIQGCQLCPVGRYQENAGQFQCDSCPYGYTTLFTGSMDRNECISVETSDDNDGLKLGLIIGASVGGVAVVGIIATIILIKVKRKPGKVDASLVNVREYECQKMPSRQKPHLSNFRTPSVLSSSDIPVKI